jgi:hypothetical protein
VRRGFQLNFEHGDRSIVSGGRDRISRLSGKDADPGAGFATQRQIGSDCPSIT